MKEFVYFEKGRKAYPIKVLAKKRPSEETIPHWGTWVVNEWTGKEWVMPCFPEITWGTLKKLTYFGELKKELPETESKE